MLFVFYRNQMVRSCQRTSSQQARTRNLDFDLSFPQKCRLYNSLNSMREEYIAISFDYKGGHKSVTMISCAGEKVRRRLRSWKSSVSASPDCCFLSFFSFILILCMLNSLAFIFFSFSDQKFSFGSDSRPILTNSVRRQISATYVSEPDSFREPTNITHILFGIAGSAKTWGKRQKYCELWWKLTTARGFVWLDESPNTTWPETSPPFKVSEDTSRFNYTSWYGSRSAIRLARIVKESFDLEVENVRWFVMGDDDTVFFAQNLVNVLAKYDHNQMYYIGANSESVEQDVIFSYKVAYGGGGFAISYPLAQELSLLLDGCIDRYASLYGGDQKVQACVSEIGVSLTRESGFHQTDIRGNAYGLLAAHPVAPLVSLHHVDYIRPLFPTMNRIDSFTALMSSYETDPSRILQQTICYDLGRNWTISVSWGYSVQLYPNIMTAKEVETALQTFQTWGSWSDGPFTFNTREDGGDPCGIPALFFLEGVERVGNGRNQTLTTYRRVGDVLEKECNRVDYSSVLNFEYVNVSAPTLDPAVWNKAPRRQCCQVINGTDGVKVAMGVEIRGCKPFESVTPP